MTATIAIAKGETTGVMAISIKRQEEKKKRIHTYIYTYIYMNMNVYVYKCMYVYIYSFAKVKGVLLFEIMQTMKTAADRVAKFNEGSTMYA